MSWLSSPWFWLLLFVFVATQYNAFCFRLLPRLASRFSHGRHRDRVVRLLEVLSWLPGLVSERARVHYPLGLAYSSQRRLEDAERQFRLALEGPITPGRAADVHRRLSDVLEAQGRMEDAEQELLQATTLASPTGNIRARIVQGDLLARTHRYTEALDAYEGALHAAQTSSGPLQAEIMLKMGFATFHDGRPDLALTWTEAAIAAKPRGVNLISAYLMAGVAHGNQGHFAQAITYARQAAMMAERDGVYTKAGRALGTVASNLMKQGDLAAALEICAHIERHGWTSRASLAIQAECLEAVGQYADAYHALEKALSHDDINEPHVPHSQRRQCGIVRMALARNHALQGYPEDAWNNLQQSVSALQGDDRLTFMWDSLAAWVLALMVRPEEATAKIAFVEGNLSRYSHDPNWKMGGLSSLGRAQYALGDYEQAAARWQAYLDAEPYPVWKPRGYFFLGDCLERLGDAERARRAYTQAATVPIADAEAGDAAWPPAPSLAAGHATGRFVDTHEARLARQRLEQGRS